MQKQTMIPGSNTDLSDSAEGYLEAVRGLEAAESVVRACKQDLIALMIKHRKKSITHNGKRLSFRAGRTVESTIVLQQAV